jgi:hypothetical protein
MAERLKHLQAFARHTVRAWRLYTRLHYSWRLAWVNSEARGF